MPPQFVHQFLRSPDEPFVPLVVGHMHRVWHRPAWIGPIFRILARRGILVASEGAHVPMTLTMVPGITTRGRPYNICARVFEFGVPARWDTVKTWDTRLDRLVEYVGRSQRLLVAFRTTYDGGSVLTLETERVALRVRGRRLWLPGWFWRAFVGSSRFVQIASDDGRHIDVSLVLTQTLLGEVFGYEGTFEIVPSDGPVGVAV